jgi:hypothetical protein
MNWPAVNQKMMDANGAKVEGEALRSGKRFIKSDGTQSKRSRIARDRKTTLTSAPIHPDAEVGREYIMAYSAARFDAFIADKEAAESIAFRAEVRAQAEKDIAQMIEDDSDDEEEDFSEEADSER